LLKGGAAAAPGNAISAGPMAGKPHQYWLSSHLPF